MRRFLKWAALVALGLLMTAPNAAATPTVTGHTGYVDSTHIAISGAGFTTACPTAANLFDFEGVMPEGGRIGGVTEPSRLKYPEYTFGTVATNRFIYDVYDSSLGNCVTVDPVAAKFGSYGMRVNFGKNNAFQDSARIVRAFTNGWGAGTESYFVSTWFKIVADDTTIAGSGAADEKLLRFSLLKILGQNANNSLSVFHVINHNDSLRCITGSGAYKTLDLAAAANAQFNDIADGDWHRLDVFVKSESTPASSSDGKMMVYLDYALMDSTRTIDWPNATQGWCGVEFCPKVTEDTGRNLQVYFDEIYLAAGHATTANHQALARVEFQDKLTFGNATERYLQFPVSWADAAITVLQRGNFDATDKVYVMPVPSGGDLLLQADTCLDSLQTAVPVLGSATASSAYLNFPAETQTFTWTNSSDNGLVGRDSKSSTTIVDWGDGETSTLTTPGDTTSTHSYAAAGTYTVTLRVTNPAGTTTGTTSYIVYNYPDEDYPFPVSGIDMKSALYDVKDSSGYRARWWRVYAPTREVEFNLYDCTGGTCTLVWPLASTFVSADDTIRTVYRGTSIDIDLGDYRANTFHYRTPLTADDDSTAVHIGWR